MSGFGQTVTMQRLAHILSCLILALALVLNGPGSVGPAKGAIMVTLCAGDAPATIWLDVDGNPVLPGQNHAKCLDCLLFAAPLPRTFSLLPLYAPLRIPAGRNLPVAVVPWHPDSRGPPRVQADALATGTFAVPSSPDFNRPCCNLMNIKQFCRFGRPSESART
jgi:hypothetical protein